MSKILPSGHGRLALQFCAVTAVAALMAGCSTDATRLSDPFSNPFATASNEPAREPIHSRTIPAGRSPPVTSRALPSPNTAVASAEPLRPRLTTAYNAPISRETTGSIEPAPVRTVPGASYGGWTSSGGVAVTVGSGDTADSLSKRYGVPANALLQTNGLRSAGEVRPGSRITIPVYNAVAVASRSEPQHAAPEHVEPQRPEPKVAHVERARPEPARVAEAPVDREEKKVDRKLAKAALLKPKAERMAAKAERPLARTVVPAKPVAPARVAVATPKSVVEKVRPGKTVTAKVEKAEKAERKEPVAVKTAAARPAPVKAEPIKTAAVKPVAAKLVPVKTAAAKPAVPIRTAAAQAAPPAAARQPDPAAAVAAPAPVADASGNPEFRWPARGRIIQGFKGGDGNDGINIAVPEGTAVKAAENGTVIYAGSEVKGYGNLVLIKHPNGFTSAYANNGELDVKKGDQVHRGETIAKSGQSGDVQSPQVHFELRKGATPVDPTKYLAGL